MALQISLLSSDLEHLATNFRLLSKEFLILQDFIRQQYGTKFTTFCNARKDLGIPASASAAPKKSPSKPCPKSKKAQESNIKVKKGKESPSNTVEGQSEFGSYAAEFSDASNSAADDGFFVVSVEDNDNTGDNDEEEGYPVELPADISVLYEDDPDCSSRGKRKSIVHRYFKMVTANDGSCKAKCKHCGMFVSKQAQRLRSHLLKCFKNDKEESLTKLVHSIPEKREEVENTSRIGRKSDRVRLLFTKITQGLARPQMQCKLCKMRVSNQPVRLKHHVLNRCPRRGEVLPNEGSASDSDNETSVDNVDVEIRKSNRKRRKVVKNGTDYVDDDDQTDEENEGVGTTQLNPESAKQVSFRDPNEQSDGVPSTSGVSVSTPYLTICSSDLLDVASHIGSIT